VCDAVTIPVVANGDIVDAGTARRALDQSGASGVMIGRGAQGQPWALAEVAASLGGSARPVRPTGQDFVSMVSAHYEAMLMFYGVKLGGRVARKHLGWYMDGADTDPALRREVLTAGDAAAVLALLPMALTDRAAA